MRAWSPESTPRLTAALQLSVRAAFAAAVAIALAQFAGFQHPLYAMLAAVIVTDLSAQRTRELGLQRVAGTVLGAAIGAAFSGFLPSGPVSAGAGILVAMFLSHALNMPGAVKLAGYVCAIVILAHHEEPWSYALLRLLETLLGIAVAWLTSLVPKLLGAPEHRPDES